MVLQTEGEGLAQASHRGWNTAQNPSDGVKEATTRVAIPVRISLAFYSEFTAMAGDTELH